MRAINKNIKTVRIHGVLVSIKNVGVLITGRSGIGKSECALELLMRGYKLIADDLVILSLDDRGLYGAADPLIKGYLELHGPGIIKIKSHFGEKALANKKEINMIIEFVDWERYKNKEIRGFLKQQYRTLLGEKLPLIKLPVSPGRDMASLVEVSVTSLLLKKRGHRETKELEERILKRTNNVHAG